MDLRQFSADKKKAVLCFLELLLQENRQRLLELVNQKVIPPEKQELLSAYGLSAFDIADLLNRILAGERPFEDWMYAHGHSAETVAEVYKVIDEVVNGTRHTSSPNRENALKHDVGQSFSCSRRKYEESNSWIPFHSIQAVTLLSVILSLFVFYLVMSVRCSPHSQKRPCHG